LLLFSKNIWKLPYLLLPLHRQKHFSGESAAIVSGIFYAINLGKSAKALNINGLHRVGSLDNTPKDFAKMFLDSA